MYISAVKKILRVKDDVKLLAYAKFNENGGKKTQNIEMFGHILTRIPLTDFKSVLYFFFFIRI